MRAVIFDIDQTIFTTDQTLREGVVELLAVLHRLGIKLGAVSDLDHRALVHLDEAGIRHFFAAVRCTDNILNPKAPASLRSLVEELGESLEHAALVSHAKSDIKHGKKAGLAKTIGVGHDAEHVDVLHRAGADHVVENLPTVLDVLH